jgi:hypothetical protein
MSETDVQEHMQAGISFGPKDYQTVRPVVASMLLTLWRERLPAQFGSYLAEVLTGEAPRATARGRNAS